MTYGTESIVVHPSIAAVDCWVPVADRLNIAWTNRTLKTSSANKPILLFAIDLRNTRTVRGILESHHDAGPFTVSPQILGVKYNFCYRGVLDLGRDPVGGADLGRPCDCSSRDHTTIDRPDRWDASLSSAVG